MRVTPLDIRKQEFRRVMRGLDTDEVYAFLQTVADEYEAVLSDNKNLRERLVELEDRLKEYRSMETNLRNTLLTAEKITAEAKENARREASLIVREAEVEAEKAADAIRAHTMQLRREILELKKQKDNYITRLKTLLDSHRKVLEGFEEDFSEVDQAIERIGEQVEMDIKQPVKPPRMSRQKITEDVVPGPEGKVTWDDERRREEEPRPSMPKPEWHGKGERERDVAPPEERVGVSPGGRGAREGDRREPAQRSSDHYDGEARRIVEQSVAGRTRPAAPTGEAAARNTGAVTAEPPSEQAEDAAGAQVELKQTQDDWKHYEVRDKKPDWTRYEVPRSRQGSPAQAPPTENEVEEALSGLNETRQNESAAPRGQAPRPEATPAGHAPAPTPKQPPGPQVNKEESQASTETRGQEIEFERPPAAAGAEETRAGGASPGAAKSDADTNGVWSMDQLRKNLSNFFGREEDGVEDGRAGGTDSGPPRADGTDDGPSRP